MPSAVSDTEPPTRVQAPPPPSGRLTDNRSLRIGALVVAMLVVFAFHFRPWEVGYMEEWPLAADWVNGGGAFSTDYVSWTLSRPLHLLPTMLGLAITGGAPWGIFLVLAVVAALQVPAVLWALRPVSRSVWVSGAVALFLALHPLWAGGYLQRFLPAQTAALAFVVALGFIARWLVRGGIGMLVAAAIVLLVGFAVYPGPTIVAPFMALVVALAVRETTWRRRIAAVATALGASAIMTLYSLVVARLLSPTGSTYELGNIEQAAVSGPRQFISLVAGTLLGSGAAVVVAIAAVIALGAILSLSGAIRAEAGWLMAGAAMASPIMSIIYFGHVGWLVDVDRLAYVMGLALFVAIAVWPITDTGSRRPLQSIAAGVLVATALVGAVTGVQHWQREIGLQHLLLDELEPIVTAADDDEIVVVIDRSATYGWMSTFPLQYLGSASAVWSNDSTMVWLCFDPPAVPAGGTACDAEDTGKDLELVRSIPMPQGTVDVYIGQKESDD